MSSFSRLRGGDGLFWPTTPAETSTPPRHALARSFAAVLFAALTWASSSDAVPKRIFIAPDDHTDYFWTIGEAGYQTSFQNMIDYYLNQADSTAASPTEQQGRWNCDGSFWMWTYEKNRSASDFNRFISRVRDGHMSVPLNALVSCYGGAPAEATLRGMYYPGQIERKYNLKFNLAVAMENQTLPYGLGGLWAGAGAKYSWRGICNCDKIVGDAANREHEIYWWVGADGSQILMKWNSLLTSNQSMGGYAEAYDPLGIVDYVDSNAAFIAKYPYSIIGAFGRGWDAQETLTTGFLTSAQTKSTATRTVIVSNEEDFFKEFEAAYGSGLPSESRSYGNEWDLYCAAMAEANARVKRSVEKLRTAESLATLVALQTPTFMDSRIGARDLAWMDLGLFWEHNFGMVLDNSIPANAQRTTDRIAWQKRLAGEIESYVNTLNSDATTALGGLIQRSGANTRFFVFNPLNWTRTDFADYPYTDTNPFHVMDLATSSETESQIVTVDGQRRIRILAKNIPSMGYKVFEVVPGAGASYANAASVVGSVIDNGLYSVTVANRGAITSLVDKTRSNREFVRTTAGGRAINDLGAGSGTLTVENAGPVSVTLLATSSGPLSHTSRITLFSGSRRVEIRNDITQNFDATNTWGFGFELTTPDVWHEEVGAVIRAKLTSAGGHYSTRNARYDWLTLNHFADMTGSGVGVTLSNADCSFMQLGASTSSSLDTTTPSISVLAGGRVASGNNGILNQGGDSQFMQRFALETHDAYDGPSAMKFSLEHQNPLATGTVTGGSAYPASSFSFMSVTDPNVVLWSLKPADDGISQGVVARVWNLAAAPTTLAITTPLGPIASAKRLTHIESPLDEAPISIVGNQIETFSFKLGAAASPAVTVTSPNGGETWLRGSSNTITWNSAGDVGLNVAITLLKAGSPVLTISSSTANDGSYAWTVPAGQTIGSDYRIQVTSVANGAVLDSSDADFSLADVVAPNTITVTSPNGTEQWQQGSSHNITWTSTGSIGANVAITLLKSGSAFSTLSASTANTGSFTWNIPANQTLGTDYRVKVSSVSIPSVYDSSDADFSVVPVPAIVVTSPNGGEQWQQGSAHSITWTTTGTVGSTVTVALYKAGSLLTTLAASAPNSGAFAWTVPANQTLGTDYKIQVTSVSSPGVLDSSDANFSIVVPPAITVTSPNGGEQWAQSTTQNITWTTAGNVGANVAITLFKGGSAVSTLSASTSNSGSFSWSVPSNQTSGSDYRIQVNSVSSPSVLDSSNANFSIVAPSITVLQPSAASAWERGKPLNLTWAIQGATGANVSIVLLKDSVVDTVLAASAPNSGSFVWNIPSGQTLGSGYQITVTSLTIPAIASTSGAFNVVEIGTLAVTNPIGLAGLGALLVAAALLVLRRKRVARS